MWSFRKLLCAIAICCAAFPALAQSTRVKLVSGGRTYDLKFAKAVRWIPRAGGSEIRLLLTVQSVGDLLLADAFNPGEFAVPRWARNSGTPAVLVSFDEKKPERSHLMLYFPEGHMLEAEAVRSGKGGKGAFRRLEVKADALSGEASHKYKQGTLTGSFRAPLTTVKEASERRGAAVAASEQASTLLSFAKAMRKLDVKNAQKFAHGDLAASVASMRSQYGEAAVKTLVRDRYGDLKQFQRDLASERTLLLEAGALAEIRLSATKKTPNGSTSETEVFRFASVNGSWKVKVEP